MSDIPERIEEEAPSMRRAITIVLVLLAGFVGGFTVGMVLRGEQVSNANSRVERRDEKIKDLEDQVAALRAAAAAAAAKPVIEPPSGGQNEGAAPAPPKTWPKGDPDTEIVETGKPKTEPKTDWGNATGGTPN